MASQNQPRVLDSKTKDELFVRNKFSMRVKYHGFFKGLLIWFWMSLVHAAAFSVQIFMRTKIGLRSYSVFTIFFSVFWLRLFLLGDFEFQSLDNSQVYLSAETDQKLRPLYGFLFFFKQLFTNFSEVGDTLVLIPKGGSPFIFLYSWMIAFLGAFNLIYVAIRGGVHSLSRGESVFFGWAYGKSGSDRSRKVVRLMIEPLFVAGVGALFFFFTKENGF